MARIAKVPQVMQMEALECGAACLTMILAYYGRWVSLEEVRADCGVSRDGSKASNVLKAARSYGLAAKGVAYSTENLRKKATFPCIVFWNFNHFVVVRGFRGNHAYINDPARGQLKIPIDEFDQSFTGITLVFEKTDQFQEGGDKPAAVESLRTYLKGMKGAIALVMTMVAVVSLATILNTALGQVFLDHIITGDDPNWLMPLMLVMLALVLVIGGVSVLNAVTFMRIRVKTAVVNSSRFMRHLLHLPMDFYAQRMVGDLQQRQTSNENTASVLIGQLAPVLINSIMLVLFLVVMLNYSVLLTIVGLVTVIINALLARYVSHKNVNIARAGAANNGKLYSATVGGIQMMETIKAAGAENGFFARWAGYQGAVNESDARASQLNVYWGMLPTLMTQIANIAVLVLGIWLIVKGAFTPGALLAFTGFLASFMAPVNQIINLGQIVQQMRTQTERIEDVMRYPVDVPEEPQEPLDTSELDREKLRGEVELKGVSFGYSLLEPPLIKDFDLHLQPGQWVALVGSSGCGKSTISRLVSGLYEPWNGQILFDGMPIKQIPRPIFCGSLAVVDQDIVTFNDTISNNVKLWDRSIEDYEVILACRDAGIHDEIISREGGYSSLISPGGRNFSGGQLQRLEIARVLAQDPTVIILDEATSALDARTEAEVIQRIRDRGITCIVVAHRLSTIRDCDEIIVLDDGAVVERGTHSELMAANGAYAELVSND